MSQPSSSARLLPTGLRVLRLSADRETLTLLAASETVSARCPLCVHPSERVHSRYARTISDLPWRGITGRLAVRARKFFCDEPSCERSIFCERLPDVAARARKTGRLEEALSALVLGLGGEAGARLARKLGLLVSPDALIARARRLPQAPNESVRVLSIDDFAFRKGHTYGTVLVDLERRRVVDLLPERSQETLVTWLKRHPGVEFAARDRSHIYREALAKGAPDAVQVTDRWHLLHNLAHVLESFLLQKQPTLRRAATVETEP